MLRFEIGCYSIIGNINILCIDQMKKIDSDDPTNFEPPP